jgi:hypothetical protein
VAKALGRLFKKLKGRGIAALPKNLRPTGSQLIREASDSDTAEAWLGRGFGTVNDSYLAVVREAQRKATVSIHKQLTEAEVFSAPAKKAKARKRAADR